MSQNKTRFPGMEESTSGKASSNSVYSRGSYQDDKKRGTQVPGMTPGALSQSPADNGKPIRGFLYSISKGVVGEYWPLRQGKNTIGASPKCDVYLPEASVSEEHASITIRILESKGKTIASLKDTDSTNGTWINGNDVDFDANPCKNGDIIRFGLNYECLLILIDTVEVGLKVSENFIPLETEPEPDDSAPIVYQRGKKPGTMAMEEKQVPGSDSHHTVLM